ncbi:MAG: response regulator [Spirochaetia bacterium]|nr:response regulator [Spirochaetia bacterium]
MSATILAVDDSETMQNMVRQVLELGGFRVILAVDGRDGLEKFKANEIHAVITDVNMPVMNGLTLISEIRRIDADIPIVTLTTESEEAMKKRGEDAGANGWIVKPFRPAQFLDVVRQLVG